MIELVTVTAPDGSSLYLGATLDAEQFPPETDVPPDVPLAVWHDHSPLMDWENPSPVEGPITAVWPVLVGGDSYFLLAGEVQEEVERVWLGLADGHRVLPVVSVLGRRVWMSQPYPMNRRDVVTVTWLPSGRSERIIVDPLPPSLGGSSSRKA